MEHIDIYNSFMNEKFSGNEFLIGLVTVWILSAVSYILMYIPSFIKKQFLKHLTTSVALNSSNDIYSVIIKYLENSNIVCSSRYLLLSNGRWGVGDLVIGMGVGTQVLIYKNKPIVFSVSKEEGTDQVVYTLSMRKIGRRHDLFYQMIREALNFDKDENKTEYYNLSESGPEFVSSQKKQYIDSMILSHDNMETLGSIIRFTKQEEFYIKNNIPYQLGLLLHGVPGSGKTSFIRALAGELGKHVVVVNSLQYLSNISMASNDSIIVIEEVDTLVGKRDEINVSDSNNSKSVADKDDRLKQMSSYTLGKMLADIDGLIQVHGRIIVMTTNHPEKLDPALMRPGRIDFKMAFDYFDEDMFKKIVWQYYSHKIQYNLNLRPCTGAELQLDFRNGMNVHEFIKKNTSNANRVLVSC